MLESWSVSQRAPQLRRTVVFSVIILFPNLLLWPLGKDVIEGLQLYDVEFSMDCLSGLSHHIIMLFHTLGHCFFHEYL